ncbi:MAG: pirin family protein [Cyanobium sp. CZS 48M]|nr:pirin family protein [Cyanobium sp. CZS48M]
MTTTPRTETLLRPAAERFHGRLDWLESWHTFSFGHHYDPAWMGYGPLRVINEDTIAPGRGFGMHPHSDMEIITVMVEGELSHRDSMGHGAVLRVGEVQRMSAGTGVVHSEINESGSPCRLLQIWIEPSSRGIRPAYEQKAFSFGDDWTLLLDPQQSEGAMAIHRPVRLWRAQPSAGVSLQLPLAAGRQAWLQLIDGAVELSGPDGSQPLGAGDGLGFVAGGSGELTATAAGTDLLLFELA